MIDWEQIQDRILSLISIEDIINKYTSNKIVRNRTACINSECSGVQERTMSLQNGYAYCFRCGKNYNQIQAVMELQKCDYLTACKTIIQDFGLPIEIDKPLSASEKKAYAKRKADIEKQKLSKKALDEFERETADKIIDKLRKCEDWKYKVDKLPLARKIEAVDKIVKVDFEIERLEWLYDVACGLPRNDDCEYEYTLPNNRIELLRAIYKGEIVI